MNWFRDIEEKSKLEFFKAVNVLAWLLYLDFKKCQEKCFIGTYIVRFDDDDDVALSTD